MASASITIRAVEALAQGETIWDAGHKEGKQSGALACDVSAATQPTCSSTGCSAASGSSRSGHTGHLGRQRRRAEKPNDCWDWSQMGKTRQKPTQSQPPDGQTLRKIADKYLNFAQKETAAPDVF